MGFLAAGLVFAASVLARHGVEEWSADGFTRTVDLIFGQSPLVNRSKPESLRRRNGLSEPLTG